MGWGAAVAAVANMVGARVQSGAIRDAANTQGRSAERALELQERMYNTARGDLASYRDAGSHGLQRLMYLMGVGPAASGLRSLDDFAAELRQGGRFSQVGPQQTEHGTAVMEPFYDGEGGGSQERPTGQFRYADGSVSSDPFRIVSGTGGFVDEEGLMTEARRLHAAQPMTGATSGDPEFGSLMRNFTLEDFQKDPGYEFRLGEGEKSIGRAMRARGMSASTATLRNLMRYNQGLASEEFANARNRHESDRSTKFNLLSFLSTSGQNASAMTGAAGANLAAGGSQALLAGGNAAAQGAIGSASVWGNAINSSVGNFMYQQRFNEMMKRMPVFNQQQPEPYDYNANAPS